MSKTAFDDDQIFAQITFKGLDYRSQTIADKEFEACVFHNCKFNQTAWKNCKFRECTFTGCNLYMASVVGCVFNLTSFEKCEAEYINWTVAAWTKQGLLRMVHFADSNINNSTFIGLSLPKMRVVRCKAQNVDFSETNLVGADFTESDLADSRFLKCDLTEANFTRAVNYAISPLLNKVKGAKFSLPQALNLLTALDVTIVDAT